MRVCSIIWIAVTLFGCFDGLENDHACGACLPCEICVQSESGEPTCVAKEQAALACGDDGHVHWLDSCGEDEGIATQCPAENAECIDEGDGEATCACLSRWEGEDCATCPPGWDPGKDCDACLPRRDPVQDCERCLGNWDVEFDCEVCLGNWDAEEGCEECRNYWTDEGDACGTCPGNHDPEKDCLGCRNRWTGEACDTCPGNWDPDEDCNACVTHWTGDDCQTCPGGWDAAEDCDECANQWTGDDCDDCPAGWDADEDCNACANQWTGSDCQTCPGNWDPDEDCSSCRNSWEGDGCDECPGNWDALADCGACRNNWEGSDCDACPGNFDPDEDCGACLPTWTGADCDSQAICIRFVDHKSTAQNPDGHSWGRAFTDVQGGIDAAAAEVLPFGGPAYCEVWVAAGLYVVHSTSPDDTVVLASDVHLYGGFAGDENLREDRDVSTNKTTLDGIGLVYHVVTGSDDAIIDGFTITRGNADNSGGANSALGGGMLNYEVSPEIRNCIFVSNYAVAGGGIYNYNTPEVLIEECRFESNIADNYGGGVMNYNSTVDVLLSVFVSNDASGGGGLENAGSATYVVASVFEGNTAQDGAGINAYLGGLAVYSSVFRDNVAHSQGGGIRSYDGLVAVRNSTFYDNSAPVIGGGAIAFTRGDTPVVINSICWGNNPNDFIMTGGSLPDVTYCNTEDARSGTGNISLNPDFVDAANGDLRLSAGSPCIDAADGDGAPLVDIEGNARVDDPDTVNSDAGTPHYADMGAYEYQP